MAKVKIEADEWFVQEVHRINGVRTDRFQFHIAESPLQAIQVAISKDIQKTLAEVYVYNSADDYHRKTTGCLVFTQAPYGKLS